MESEPRGQAVPLNAVSVGLTEKWLLNKIFEKGLGEPREAWRKAFRQIKHPGSEGSTLGHSGLFNGARWPGLRDRGTGR